MMDALLEMMQSSLLVWTTADSKRQGFLGFKEFVFAMQLVSLVQEGHQISHDLLNGDDFENIRPPVMEGLDTLIMRKKQSSKSSSLESNGSSSNQTSPASQLFSSKSSKKISLSSATSIIDGLKRFYL
ncbi:EH domain-containing protein 1 isoform X2 [Gossypium hirsutum]|uniref:EH domain-containing protein 1 isoform X2 n=1 Tax=Gossypium hirsutum TaxID=3635 RepID=A0A1U8JR75_GOSHI|nr:EH domain-containing protein 1 isoform X2 [Gossypium hirsutum]